MHQKHANMEENVYKFLKKKCIDLDLDIKDLCEKAGVARTTVMRWKTKEPNTILIYRKLLSVIEEAEKKRNGA